MPVEQRKLLFRDLTNSNYHQREEMYTTIEEAEMALRTAELDCAADFGEEKVEEAYADLVHSIAACCPDPIAAELIRRKL